MPKSTNYKAAPTRSIVLEITTKSTFVFVHVLGIGFTAFWPSWMCHKLALSCCRFLKIPFQAPISFGPFASILENEWNYFCCENSKQSDNLLSRRVNTFPLDEVLTCIFKHLNCQDYYCNNFVRLLRKNMIKILNTKHLFIPQFMLQYILKQSFCCCKQFFKLKKACVL